MNSRIISCQTHTPNLRIPNSRKIPGPKNHKLRRFAVHTYFTELFPCLKNLSINKVLLTKKNIFQNEILDHLIFGLGLCQRPIFQPLQSFWTSPKTTPTPACPIQSPPRCSSRPIIRRRIIQRKLYQWISRLLFSKLQLECCP